MVTTVEANIPARYLGQVATRCRVCNATSGNTWGMSRTKHWLRADVSTGGLKVGYFNGYLNGSNNSETNNGAATLKVSIEDEAGTITLCDEGTVSDTGGGLMIVTFSNFRSTRGKYFYLRALMQIAGGVPYAGGFVTGWAGLEDGYVTGSGTPNDLTGGGAVTSTGAFNNEIASYPALIAAYTRRSSALILGDSRAFGTGETVSDGGMDVGNIARLLGPSMGYCNFAVPSVAAVDFLTGTKTVRLALAPYFTHVINQLGTNDIGNKSRTAAQTKADRASIAALFPNNYVVGTTLEPITTSTDSWATTTNQSTSGPAIQTFNGLVRAGISGERSYIDIADGMDPYRSAKFPVSYDPSATSGTAGFATTDGIHMTAALSEIVRRRTNIAFLQN